MAKLVQRTITVTIIETWALAWAGPETPQGGAGAGDLFDAGPRGSLRGCEVGLVQTITVSSSASMVFERETSSAR